MSRLGSFAPRTSLLTRTNAVLGVSSVAIAITAIWSFNVFVTTPISERSAAEQAGLLVLSANTWVELPEQTRPQFELTLLVNHDLIISGEARDLPVVDDQDDYHDMLKSEIEIRVDEPVEIMEGDGLLWADIRTRSGDALQIGFSSQRSNIQPLFVGLVIVVFGAAIVFGTSFYIVQRLAGPLVRVSDAAQEFRGSGDFTPLPEEGPNELVSLAASFNDMARDIAALLTNRTTLLAGISHDLRTPLARMRLAVELLPDSVDASLVERLERNLEAMDELIGNALRFARGTQEAPEEVELMATVRSMVRAIDDSINVQGTSDARMRIAPGAFNRVLTNLVNNARRHAGGAAIRVCVGETIEVHVVDRGPGIPKAEREKVFQPFYRLDRSRSSTTGGSGLGLAIVSQLCHAHGWRVELNNVAGGGTDACLTIPRAPLNETA